MPREEGLWSTGSVIVGQRPFSNYNGIGIGLMCSLQQPLPGTPSSATAVASAGSYGSGPPNASSPPLLAVVIDASMDPESLSSALDSLQQALNQLPPKTHILLAVADQVVSFFDLQAPQPQAWVLHGSGAGAAAAGAALPRLVHAAGIRPTPLSACSLVLPNLLASVRHYPQHQTLERHLHTLASALDLCIYLLATMAAAWDAAHASAALPLQQQRQQAAAAPDTPPPPLMHNARVILVTGQAADAAIAGTPSAGQQQQQLDVKVASIMHSLFASLGAKAADADVPIDVMIGSAAAPSLPFLEGACDACGGQVLLQEGLQPPLAANLAAYAQRRIGWRGVLTVTVPPGVKVTELSATAAAAAAGGPPAAAPAPAAAAAAGGGAIVSLALPAVQGGSCLAVSLELLRDVAAGAEPLSVQVAAEWTGFDGRHVQQATTQQLHVTERLGAFLDGLQPPAVAVSLARRLVAGALRAGAPARRAALEEARLSVGMALAHIAQRLGVQQQARRRGLLGFRSQQEWQLPQQLAAVGLALYQLQRGPLLGGGGSVTAAARRLGMRQFLGLTPAMALAVLSPALHVLDPVFGSFEMAPAVDVAVGPATLAVMDCGTELLIYVGAELSQRGSSGDASGSGAPAPADVPAGAGASGNGHAAPAPPTPQPPPSANGGGGGGGDSTAGLPRRGSFLAQPASLGSADVAVLAGPGVQLAQQLARGRLPVPRVRLVEVGSEAEVSFLARLVPLHREEMDVQMAVLPWLQQLSTRQHGSLIQWHAELAAARTAAGGAGGAAEPGLAEWCGSFGVSLPRFEGRSGGSEEGTQ